MPTVLLVRHATSEPPRVGGLDDLRRPLTTTGLAQAAALGGSLRAAAPVRILSSPYLRAVQTVAPLAAALGLEVDRREELREWASGIDPRPDWQDHYGYCWAHPGWSTESGESHQALTDRAVAAVHRAAEEAGEGVTVLGSHGTWISRALLGLGCAVDADFWLAMPMPAVYEVRLERGVVRGVNGPGFPVASSLSAATPPRAARG